LADEKNTFSPTSKSIVITNPARNLICRNNAIEVTLANGDVMTIPIEGNINVNLAQDIKLHNSDNNR
jgi:hypothetical protein